MKTMQASASIDAYIAAAPKAAQPLLKQMRKLIKAEAPDATETIGYGIPTFKLHGNLVHFGGYATHIGFYPGPAAIKKFAKQLKPYATSKGAIRFPLEEPLPLALVKDIVRFRVRVQEEGAG